MCGIAGIFGGGPAAGDRLHTLKRMLALIQHRGPDETGYYIDDQAALGTVRLSIIDLASGQQPISDPSGRYWICYNGELYNYLELRETLAAKGYRFQTTSDTEVLLTAWICWGEACLPRFNGAFAFAIYDAEAESLFLARDRYGKRPLFLARHEGSVLFASEMKAFLGVEGFRFAFDPEQMAAILAHWTPLPQQSGFLGIEQLPMASWLTIDRRGTTRGSYETLDFRSTYAIDSEADALAQIRQSLEQSVRLRLRSDTTVGVYLSGGLDSSIITLLATQQAKAPVNTFSVEFEDEEFDESGPQQALVDHLQTRHSRIRISHGDIARHFPEAIYHAEVPAFRTAFVPMFLLAQKVREHGIKVVLSGEGADETFLGYNLFKESLLRRAWHTLTVEERKQQVARLHPYLRHFGEEHQTQLLGLYHQFAEERMPGLFSHEIRFQNGRFSAKLLPTGADPFEPLYALTRNDPAFSELDTVQRAQWLEFKTLLAGYLLSTQGERMSLAHGVENRCPFLDADLVALSSAVNLKFDDGTVEKYLLKMAYAGELPRQIIERHKHPYRAPDSAAFVDARPDYLEAVLSETELRKIDGLDARFASALVRKVFATPASQISIRENQSFVYLLALALLHRGFVRGEGVPGADVGRVEAKLARGVDRRKSAGAAGGLL